MVRVFGHYVPAMILTLVLVDLLVVNTAVVLATYLAPWVAEGPLWTRALALSAVVLFTLYVGDLYRVDRLDGRRELIARLALVVGVSGLMTAALGFAIPDLRMARLAFFQIFTLLAVGLLTWRLVWLEVRPVERLRKRVLVLGLSNAAPAIAALEATGSRPFSIIGFLDDAPDAHDRLPAGTELLGKTRDLLNLVDELQPDIVLVALPDMRGSLPAVDLLECRLRGIGVEDWPTFYEKQTGKVLVTNMRPSWLIFSDGFVKTHVTQVVKRGLDVTLALAGLVLSLPVMAIIAVLVKLDSRGPVLFRQERVGQNGRVFVLKKFRSMRTDAESSGAVWAAKGDRRVTRVGRFIRRTRLDELPQFFNVLVGDMSFIGPRPERPEFVRMLQRQIPFYMERHSVKPGITGWAQVRCQYAASVEDSLEKLQYDLYYIKNLSSFLDLVILVSTIQVVLFARGSR